MRDVVYHQYAAAFENHWWADHRRLLVTDWLRRAGVEADGSHPVLEIGSGAGTDHHYWNSFGPVTGVELNQTALSFCRQRGYASLIEGDLNTVELQSDRFELAVEFHVLYHVWVHEPQAVLRKLRSALRPGGYLVMTEPAFEALRRGHDEAVMAARRWTRGELKSLVEGAGFEVLRITGYLSLLLPVVLASLLVDRVRKSEHEVDEIKRPGWLADKLLRLIMACERALTRIHPLPVGTSWLLLARKR